MAEKKKLTGNEFITLGLPEDKELLSAIARVTIRHGQLDHILKMTIKVIENVSIEEAIDAAGRSGSGILRERIAKLAKKKIGDGEAYIKLQALLRRAERATEQRNEMIHSLWGTDKDGVPLVRKSDHSWETVPAIEDLDKLSDEILQIIKELNEARLMGFLELALRQKKSEETRRKE